jgi:hypothetical protein
MLAPCDTKRRKMREASAENGTLSTMTVFNLGNAA